jgi:aerobic-type carbon monoxide dehydrogenase small subunit (CoxS/CutS family)
VSENASYKNTLQPQYHRAIYRLTHKSKFPILQPEKKDFLSAILQTQKRGFLSATQPTQLKKGRKEDPMTEEKKKKESGEISRRGFLKDSGLIVSGAAIGSTGLLSVQNGEAANQTITVSKFVCPACEQEFDSLAELQSHFKDTHGEEPAPAALNIAKFNVNGRPYEVQVKPSQTLYEVIHDVLGLTGVKVSCDRGACGFCTVIVNGRPILSCMTLAIDCQDANIETIEGIAEENHPIIEAWIKYEGMQCGFCTSGAILTAKNLLDRNPSPTEDEIREALSGNLCRCVAYPAWTKAVLHASGKEV